MYMLLYYISVCSFRDADQMTLLIWTTQVLFLKKRRHKVKDRSKSEEVDEND